MSRLLAAAEAEIGTRFVPQGRLAGIGLDCVGLAAVAARACGVDVESREDYSLTGSDYSEMLLDYMRRNCHQVSADAAQSGDFLLFWINKPNKPRHLGILADTQHFIHTNDSVGRVTKTIFDERWRKRVHSAWRLN